MFFFIGQKIGLSVGLTERLFLYLNFILPGLGMYYLTSVVFPKIHQNAEAKRLACWIAALFFMFCPVLLKQPQVYWFYGVFPFMLAFFIKTIDMPDLKDKIVYSFFAAIFSFGFLMFIPNGQMAVIFILTIALYSLWAHIFFKISIKEILKSWVIFSTIVILINLGFIVPFIFTLLGQGTQMLASTPISFSQSGWLEEGPHAMAGNLILTYGLGPEGGRYLPTGFYYLPGLVLYLINFLLAILAFSAVVVLRKSKMVLFFAFTAFCGILIVQGPNIPFGPIYKWILSNFLIARIFRTTAMVNTVVALSYAILIAATFAELHHRISRHFKGPGQKNFMYLWQAGLAIVFISLIMVNGWPMITGAYYNTPDQWPNNVMRSVPSDYYALDAWVVNHENPQNIRLLALPAINGYQSVSWADYWVMAAVIPYISTTPVIFSTGGRESVYSPLIQPIYDASVQDPKLMAKLAGLSNVKYFYVDNYDANSKYLNRTYFADNDPDASIYSFERSIGDLDLYQIRYEYVLPRIYGTSNVQMVKGDIYPDFVERINSTGNFSDSPVFFVERQFTADSWNLISNFKPQSYNPVIKFQQIDPTHYEVSSESQYPYILILNTEYSPYWTAMINGKEIDDHVIANGYANAWYIDQVGQSTISIEYKIQTYYLIALLISALVFLICAGYLALNFIKGGKHDNT